MEDDGNIFEKQVIGMMSKTKVGKPPTRLQKHAPASLQLDQMKADAAAGAARNGDFGASNGGTYEAATPIPLLTPLAMSPSVRFPETEEEFVFPIDDRKEPAEPAPTPTSAVFGWKNPAGAGYVEASALFALFQNKCVLFNEAQ
ncbi:hypothetical protein PTKIN_Ptkin11bG0033000 [Pterospermum kingtungense]